VESAEGKCVFMNLKHQPLGFSKRNHVQSVEKKHYMKAWVDVGIKDDESSKSF
jgi:hypothetical protein